MKMDQSLIEAAEDLGGDKRTVFFKVIFPLSLPGILSGVSMVFMPAVSTFVISNLLYGGQYMLIGNLIEQQYLVVNDWNFGSAVAIILMLLILVSMAVMNRFGGSSAEERGVNLW
jgi:spermidine/putrescine transport system permease protein